MRNYLLITAILMLQLVSACGTEKFFAAAESGDVQEVKRLMAAGADINARDQQGQTVLFYAAFSGSGETASTLIEHGADINAADREGLTPLHVAAYQSRWEIVELLIRKGARVNARTREGETSLSKAIEWFAGTRRGHQALVSRSEIDSMLSTVKLLLDNGAEVNAADTYGVSPLILAAASGEKALVELLLDRGAAVNDDGYEGKGALYVATVMDQPEIASLLIDHGAEIDAKTNKGITPLSEAARDGNRNMAELLMAAGADVNAKDAMYGRTPLVWALRISAGVFTPGESLIRKNTGAEEQVAVRKAIHGMKGQWLAVAGKLIDRGADVNAVDSKGYSPLYLAVVSGDHGLVQKLIDHGADLDDLKAGESPLHAAIAERRREIAALLINKGANVNTGNKVGRTPLHYLAGFMDNASMAELLIEHGADVNASDKDGKRPLDFATKAGNRNVVEVLRAHGARGRATKMCL